MLYAEQAKAAGININVVREPNDGYYSDVWLKKPFCLVSWGARPTPDVMYTLAYKDDAAWNESHWQNERFNKLLLQAKAELDDEQARRDVSRDGDAGPRRRRHDHPVLQQLRLRAPLERRHGPNSSRRAGRCDGARAASRWWFNELSRLLDPNSPAPRCAGHSRVCDWIWPAPRRWHAAVSVRSNGS